MFACYGGDRFWPLTADVAVFHAPLDRTVRALWPRPRRRGWPRRRYPRHETLAAALAARTQHALLLVATNDRRTAVLSTAGLDHGWLRERAALDLRCDLVRTTFRPAGTDVDTAARFGDLRIEPPAEPNPSDPRQAGGQPGLVHDRRAAGRVRLPGHRGGDLADRQPRARGADPAARLRQAIGRWGLVGPARGG